MPKSIRATLMAVALLGLVGGSQGCGKPTSYGSAQSSASWTHSDADAVPGIDNATVTSVRIMAGPPEGVSFVVWSDLSNGSSGGGGGSARDGAHYKGRHFDGQGRTLEFEARTVDGKTGSVTIAGKPYDLAAGQLFLASTQGNEPVVAQLRFDLREIPEIKGESLQEAAKSIPEIRGFFEEHRQSNSTDAESAK